MSMVDDWSKDGNTGMPQSPLVPRMVTNPRDRPGNPQSGITGGVDRTVLPESGSDPTVSSNLTALTARVTALETKIAGARLGVVCNEDGSITATLTWGT